MLPGALLLLEVLALTRRLWLVTRTTKIVVLVFLSVTLGGQNGAVVTTAAAAEEAVRATTAAEDEVKAVAATEIAS